MGSSNSKVECLQKPAQSGKTRTMQERIREYEDWSRLWGNGKSPLSIVISSNNKSLVAQTTARMNTDLFEISSISSDSSEADDSIVGSCFSWSSGTKHTNISVDALAFKIISDEVKMVVCCAHKTRLNYLYTLMTTLERSRHFDNNINIFIDEADYSIKLWSNPAIDASLLSKVNKIMLVSATFNSVIDKYNRIRMIPLVDTYNIPTYHKIAECNIIEDNTIGSAVDYLKTIYAKYETELQKPGTRLFAPGDITVASHDAVAEFLQSKGFVVMILNGRRKCVIMPSGEVINIADHMGESGVDEVGAVMTRIYHDNAIYNYPFAVTGQMCLGRGLTFQNEQFLFDYGIVANISDTASAYQCVCRLAGNIKHLPGYTPSTLITTSRMKEVVLNQEDIASNLAKRVYDENLTHVDRKHFGMDDSSSVSSSKSRRVRTGITTLLQEFLSMDALNTALLTLDPTASRKRISARNIKDGVYMFTLGGKQAKLEASDIRNKIGGPSNIKYFGEELKEVDEGRMAHRIYVGYDGDVPIFFLRTAKPPMASPEQVVDIPTQ